MMIGVEDMKRLMLRYEGGSEVKLLEGYYLCPKLMQAAVELAVSEDELYVQGILRTLDEHGVVGILGGVLYVEDTPEYCCNGEHCNCMGLAV
jgi:hypothetical protein